MNNAGNSYPRGTDVEVFNLKSLQKTYFNAKERYQREHVTAYIYENPTVFKIEMLEARGFLNKPMFRFCVDTEEDLEVVRRIFYSLTKSASEKYFINCARSKRIGLRTFF